MEKEIKEYGDAIQAHMNARKNEVVARDTVKKTHYRVLKAREALKSRESDILEDIERL